MTSRYPVRPSCPRRWAGTGTSRSRVAKASGKWSRTGSGRDCRNSACFAAFANGGSITPSPSGFQCAVVRASLRILRTVTCSSSSFLMKIVMDSLPPLPKPTIRSPGST